MPLRTLSRPLLLISTWLISLVSLISAQADSSQANPSISELESRLSGIQSRIDSLAYPSLNTGVAPIGYRSPPKKSADETAKLTIELSEPALIDKIVLVPPIWRAGNAHFQADAFPQALSITGKSPTQQSTQRNPILLKDLPDTSDLLPRIAPVVIPLSTPQVLSSVTIEADKLAQRAINGDYIFQLAEVFLFSGDRNVALHQKVILSHPTHPTSRTKGWGPEYLVDGIVPYLMDSSQGESSLPFVSNALTKVKSPSLIIDLGKETLLDGIRFHTVDQGDTLPQTYPGDYGLPKHFILETASDPSFQDARPLLKAHIKAPGPMHSWPLAPIKARYLRLRIISPYLVQDQPRFGLAEIEIFSNSKNILLGKKITTNFPSSAYYISPSLLTDGKNFYGNIIPIRQWMEQLAERHELENEKLHIETSLNQRYQSQQKNLQRLLWSSAIVTIGFIALLLYSRLKRIRQESLIRERIASNLHDELGANLHALGLIGKLVEQSIDKPDRLKTLTHRIHTLTHLTGNATRDCSHMLRNKNLHNDLLNEMKRQAKLLLCDLSYDFDIKQEALLKQLPRQSRIDLHLFHKEALTNIIKHSHAQNVSILLTLHRSFPYIHVTLDIIDDGSGMTEPAPSITRRAKLLRAKLTCLPPQKSGTHLQLSFKRISIF